MWDLRWLQEPWVLQRPWACRCYSGAGFDNVLYVQFVFFVFCNKYLW